MATQKERERAAAVERLKVRGIRPGDKIYCILRHVSKSGMSRVISFQWIDREGNPHLLDYSMAQAIDAPHTDKYRGGVKMDGCGTDMGFEGVYQLGRALFPEGFGVKSLGGIRPKTKEEAARLVAEGKIDFLGRNGDKSGWDNDGGYALKHVWL